MLMASECHKSELFLVYIYNMMWMFPKIGVPQNGWFIMEKTILKWMIWGQPTIFGNTHIYIYICIRFCVCSELSLAERVAEELFSQKKLSKKNFILQLANWEHIFITTYSYLDLPKGAKWMGKGAIV